MSVNWFSVGAGACFIAAVPYGIWLQQDWRVLVLYGAYALVNIVAATL